MKRVLKQFEKITFVLFVIAVVLLLRARLPQTLPTSSNVHFGEQRDTIPLRMRLDAAFKISKWQEDDWGITKVATATIGEFEYKFIADPFNRKWRFWTESIGNVEKLAFLQDWRANNNRTRGDHS